MRRVVITGLGLISPLACGVEETWSRILNGDSGADLITRFNADRVATKYACEVPQGDGLNGTFNADDWMEPKERRKVDDFILYGIAASEMAVRDADWKPIEKVKNNPRMFIPVFGNGDVDSPEKALEMKNKYGLDGAMIGRASIGNPWFFNRVKYFMKTGKYKSQPSLEERVEVAKRHLEMSVAWKGPVLGVLETRRHYTNYFKGYHNFKPFRKRMVTSNSAEEVYTVLNEVLEVYGARAGEFV